MKVLVTGASGFVGKALCTALKAAEYDVVPATRDRKGLPAERVVGQIDAHTDWRAALEGVEGVVHLAARVHVMHDDASDPLGAFRAVNTEGTLNLARQCASAGVRRFVFVSSIKVNGEGRDSPYSESDRPAPQDPYAISKWEAEQGLRELSSATGMDVVTLRPPLIYGPGVGANFLRLTRSVAKGRPLPFGRVHNRRSLLFLGNLTDAIGRCLEHSAAPGKTFLLSDGDDVSSADLVRRLAWALNRSPRLLPVPPSWLRAAGTIVGRSAEIERLVGSLCVDSARIRSELDWHPPFSVDEGLRLTAAHYLQRVG